MSPYRLPRQSLWNFSPLTLRSGLVTLVGLVAVAVVPLLALLISDRAAAFILAGLAVAITREAADAALVKLSGAPFQLSIGFWLMVLTVFVLVWSAVSMRPVSRPPDQWPVPALVG